MADVEVETVLEDTTPNFTGVMVYGIVADLMVLLPIIFYMVFNTDGYSKHHQTMINMITSSWMPFAIVWLIVFIQDSPVARMALTGALEMAALGPFALMWVGYMAFLMSAQASDVLGQTANLVWAIVYPVCNIGLIIMHWILSPSIYNWIENGAMLSEVVEVTEEPEDEFEPEDEEEFEEEVAEGEEEF